MRFATGRVPGQLSIDNSAKYRISEPSANIYIRPLSGPWFCIYGLGHLGDG